MSLIAVQIYEFHTFTTVSCENTKERKAHVDKIALWNCDQSSQFYFLPAKVAWLLWKLMKQKSERLEMSLTYCTTTLSKNFAPYATSSLVRRPIFCFYHEKY